MIIHDVNTVILLITLYVWFWWILITKTTINNNKPVAGGHVEVAAPTVGPLHVTGPLEVAAGLLEVAAGLLETAAGLLEVCARLLEPQLRGAALDPHTALKPALLPANNLCYDRIVQLSGF